MCINWQGEKTWDRAANSSPRAKTHWPRYALDRRRMCRDGSEVTVSSGEIRNSGEKYGKRNPVILVFRYAAMMPRARRPDDRVGRKQWRKGNEARHDGWRCIPLRSKCISSLEDDGRFIGSCNLHFVIVPFQEGKCHLSTHAVTVSLLSFIT